MLAGYYIRINRENWIWNKSNSEMKNILITGANGQLGNEMRLLAEVNKEYTYFLQMLLNWIYVMSRL